jgi:ubiquinone/menaquinone biosynthesis C-methylase UbiE
MWLAAVAWIGLVGAPTAARSAESDQIVTALGLVWGETVADVGAGDGQWTESLSEAVGPTGRVFATEVGEEGVDRLRRRFESWTPANVTVVKGSEDATGLPEGCCDAVLLRLVYHHLTKPKRIVADLHRIVRPRGRVAIIDMTPQARLPPVAGVPDRGGHGVEPKDVMKRMRSAGFRVTARYDAWADRAERFCIVFARE